MTLHNANALPMKGTYRSVPLALGCALAISAEAGAAVLGYEDERFKDTTRVLLYTASNKMVAQLKSGRAIDLGEVDVQTAEDIKGLRTLVISRPGENAGELDSQFVSIRRI